MLARKFTLGLPSAKCIPCPSPANRLCWIIKALGWLGDGQYIESPVASVETLTRFHDANYIKELREADFAGTGTGSWPLSD